MLLRTQTNSYRYYVLHFAISSQYKLLFSADGEPPCGYGIACLIARGSYLYIPGTRIPPSHIELPTRRMHHIFILALCAGIVIQNAVKGGQGTGP